MMITTQFQKEHLNEFRIGLLLVIPVNSEVCSCIEILISWYGLYLY